MSFKVFDLKLLLGRENIMGNKPKITIESMETSGKNLYVGTNDGTLYHFFILEDVAQDNANNSANAGAVLTTFLQNQKRISTKKAIVQIKAASELNCLLINSDGSIHAYSMIDLTPAFAVFGKLKNVSRFYVNANPVHANPFAVEICVSYIKKKNVQLYQIQEDNIVPLKDISLPEHPLALALDGHHMCVGTNSDYIMVDLESGVRQELLPVTETKVFVQRVAAAEFLLAAPNDLCVFVTSAGISQRPPLQWSGSVSHATYIHPYVIAMDDEFITIHSVLDQQQKQTLPFQGGNTMFRADGKLLVCTTKDIFVLTLVPYEQQISNLLLEDKVDEAMELAKACRKCMSRKEYREMMLTTYKKAGFLHFQKQFFEAAQEMFRAGCIDIREVISLYPGILPSDSTFVRNTPCYHSIPNILQMCNDDKEKISQYEQFMASYLEMHPLPVITSQKQDDSNPFSVKLENTAEYRSDIYRSSVNIFTKLHWTPQLLDLMQGKHKPVSPHVPQRSALFNEFLEYHQEICQVLDDAGCYHAYAMYLLLGGDIDHAMLVWKELAEKHISDKDFPGLPYVAECLGRYSSDLTLLWKHSEWIVKIDQAVGVSIFTKHIPQSEFSTETQGNVSSPKIDDVIAFLHHYPESLTRYLEHLILDCRIQKEKYHTHLSVLYLDQVLKLKEQKDDIEILEAARQKLQTLLKKSNMYRVTLILGKIKDSDLFAESVILHGKLGEHDKALGILVNKMENKEAAEQYCLTQSSDAEHRKQLFGNLLSIYLSKVSAATNKSSKSVMAVVDLLNNYAENYDAPKVLSSIPKTWSITLLSQFLSRTVRLQMHTARTEQLQHMLERSENNNVKKEHIGTLNKSFCITEDKICQACNRLFQDSDCVVYPNGIAVHRHCGSNKLVCPVTGRLFKTLPPPKR